MEPTIIQFSRSAYIPAPRPAVFAHWMDPNARLRYEAPEGSGMRYKSYSDEQGGVEVIEIVHDGEVVGEMVQRITILNPPALLIHQVTGTFFGTTSMALQVTVRFEDEEGGTGIYATSQVVDTTGRDIQPEHEAGWMQMFEKFAEDFAAHGPNE